MQTKQRVATVPKFTFASLCLAFAIMLLVGLAGPCVLAYADDTKSASKSEYDEALDRLNRLSDEYSSLAIEKDKTLARLQEIESSITDNEAQIVEVQKAVEASENDLKAKKDALAVYVSSDYKTGGVSLLSILLSSSSFEDAISKVHYYGVICQDQTAKILEVNSAKNKLQARKSELEKLENELRAQEADARRMYEEQSELADQMYAQQIEAAELLVSLPTETQEELGSEGSELVSESQAFLKQEENVQSENTSSNQNNESTSGNTQTKKTNNNTETKSTVKQTPTVQPTTTPGASGTRQLVLDSAYSTTKDEAISKGWGCSGWVFCVFRNCGVYTTQPSGACWYYNNWCYTSDKSQIEPGMIVAVSTWTGTAAGKIYGHVGIYVGNGMVRHLSSGEVREMSLDAWINRYGTTVTPKWGWNGGIVLT